MADQLASLLRPTIDIFGAAAYEHVVKNLMIVLARCLIPPSRSA